MTYRRHRRKFPVRPQSRNFDDPQYIKFRKEVKKRDGYCCQWPDCKERKRLQVHHVRGWAEQPLVRFQRRNGITLCRKHHEMISGQEVYYQEVFDRIIIQNENK